MFFMKVEIEGVTYRVYKSWLGPVLKEVLKDTPIARMARAITANNVELIDKRRGQIFKALEKHLAELSTQPGNDNKYLSLDKLIAFGTGSAPAALRVFLPYTMYGEYMPSIVALASGGSIVVHHPGGKDPKALMATLRIFGVSLSAVVGTTHGPFDEVHFRFAHTHTPSIIRQGIEDLVTTETNTYCRALYDYAANGCRLPAPSVSSSSTKPAKKAPAKVASLGSASSVATVRTVSFCIWIRQAPTNTIKNMTDALLDLIMQELARIVMLAAPQVTGCEVILLGDRKPVGRYATSVQMLEPLQRMMPGIVASIVDLRGYFDTGEGAFAAFHNAHPPIGTSAYPGSGSYLSYYLQWTVLNWLVNQRRPAFVVGSESGNMDAMGHMGAQVISIDLTDPVAGTETSLLVDRIGQYALMTPLWQVVNYESGRVNADFCSYLRGAMLRYFVASQPDLASVIDARMTSSVVPTPTSSLASEPKPQILLKEDVEGKGGTVVDAEVNRTFAIEAVPGGGDCLFHAIARVRGGDAATQRAAAAHGHGLPADIGTAGVAVDTTHLAAVANALGITIVLYEGHYGETTARRTIDGVGAGPTVYLLLRTVSGQADGHYDLLR